MEKSAPSELMHKYGGEVFYERGSSGCSKPRDNPRPAGGLPQRLPPRQSLLRRLRQSRLQAECSS